MDPVILTSEKVYKVQIGGEVKLECDVTNLGDMVLMWKQGRRVLTAGRLMVRRDPRLRLEGTNLIMVVLDMMMAFDKCQYSVLFLMAMEKLPSILFGP